MNAASTPVGVADNRNDQRYRLLHFFVIIFNVEGGEVNNQQDYVGSTGTDLKMACRVSQCWYLDSFFWCRFFSYYCSYLESKSKADLDENVAPFQYLGRAK